jgi:hypothetical protein
MGADAWVKAMIPSRQAMGKKPAAPKTQIFRIKKRQPNRLLLTGARKLLNL